MNKYTKEYHKRYYSDPVNRLRGNANAVSARKRMKTENPIHHKAMYMAGGLRWGKGATKRMEEILEEAIGTPCIFCSTIITLENCSLDHNVPAPRYGKLEKKRRGMFHKDLTPEQLRERNNEENLHIICFSCNRAKSNLTGSQFLELLLFLDKDPVMKKIVLSKMRSSNLMWKHN